MELNMKLIGTSLIFIALAASPGAQAREGHNFSGFGSPPGTQQVRAELLATGSSVGQGEFTYTTRPKGGSLHGGITLPISRLPSLTDINSVATSTARLVISNGSTSIASCTLQARDIRFDYSTGSNPAVYLDYALMTKRNAPGGASFELGNCGSSPLPPIASGYSATVTISGLTLSGSFR